MALVNNAAFLACFFEQPRLLAQRLCGSLGKQCSAIGLNLQEGRLFTPVSGLRQVVDDGHLAVVEVAHDAAGFQLTDELRVCQGSDELAGLALGHL